MEQRVIVLCSVRHTATACSVVSNITGVHIISFLTRMEEPPASQSPSGAYLLKAM